MESANAILLRDLTIKVDMIKVKNDANHVPYGLSGMGFFVRAVIVDSEQNQEVKRVNKDG